MDKNILFVASGWEPEVQFHAAIARALRKRGATVSAVAVGRYYANAYREQGCYERVDDLALWMRDQWPTETGDELVAAVSAAESRYGYPGIWQYLAADRFLCFRDYPYNLRVALSQMRFWDELMADRRPDLLVGEISHFHNYLAWAAGKSNGVSYAHLIPSRIKRHAAIGNVFEHRDMVRLRSKRFLSEGAPDELRAQARQYIEAYRADSNRASHLPPVSRWFQSPVGSGSLKGFLRGIRTWMSYERNYNYTLAGPGTKVRRWFLTRARKMWMQWCSFFDETGTSDQPFVLFGLHLQPESSTLVRGQFFQDMLAVARNVALSLPATHRLYVKEHDVMFGHRPIHFFRELKKIPNVVLVSPYESGPELVRRADAVIAVTGTFGWDAALLRKPAIVLGEPFFNSYRGIDHVTDMTRLPAILHERLAKGVEGSEEELELFVAAVLDCVVDANMDDLWGFRGGNLEGDADKLAGALLDYRDPALES